LKPSIIALVLLLVTASGLAGYAIGATGTQIITKPGAYIVGLANNQVQVTNVRVSNWGPPTSTITITASDPGGAAQSGSFNVTIAGTGEPTLSNLVAYSLGPASSANYTTSFPVDLTLYSAMSVTW
jgi:hypothetical protein